ncbi:MAG TPA: hypothetical protein VF753_13750 [Terriglobales bacterium]
MKRILASLVLLMAAVFPAAAATGAAQLKGTYYFSITGITTVGGYYTGSTWHYVSGACPKSETCMNQTFQKVSVGTISFNGAGKATFLTVTNYDPSGEPDSGGPAKGAVWPYTVNGVNGLLGTESDGAAIVLGAFNSAGIASVVQIFIADTNPKTGVATLQ